MKINNDRYSMLPSKLDTLVCMVTYDSMWHTMMDYPYTLNHIHNTNFILYSLRLFTFRSEYFRIVDSFLMLLIYTHTHTQAPIQWIFVTLDAY